MPRCRLAFLLLVLSECTPVGRTSLTTHQLGDGHLHIGGSDLAYHLRGHGQTIVFVHGAGEDLRAWAAQEIDLATRYQTVTYSRRGHPPSRGAGGPYTVTTHVEDLAALLQALSPRPVVLVGHSYGADLALRLALAHPQLVRGLVLDEAPATPLIANRPDYVMIGQSRSAAIKGMRAALATGDSVEAIRLLIDWTNAAPGTYASLTAAQREEALGNSAALAAMLDAPPPPPLSCGDLGTIRVPVLLVEGGRTNPYYHLSTDALSRCLSTSTHTVLPQAAHDASWQDSRGFNDALIAFVDGLHPLE